MDSVTILAMAALKAGTLSSDANAAKTGISRLNPKVLTVTNYTENKIKSSTYFASSFPKLGSDSIPSDTTKGDSDTANGNAKAPVVQTTQSSVDTKPQNDSLTDKSKANVQNGAVNDQVAISVANLKDGDAIVYTLKNNRCYFGIFRGRASDRNSKQTIHIDVAGRTDWGAVKFWKNGMSLSAFIAYNTDCIKSISKLEPGKTKLSISGSEGTFSKLSLSGWGFLGKDFLYLMTPNGTTRKLDPETENIGDVSVIPCFSVKVFPNQKK